MAASAVGNTVGEPDAPFTQVRLVLYCNALLTLPAAISSKIVVATLDDKVATALPKGPLPAPVEVADASSALLLVARTP